MPFYLRVLISAGIISFCSWLAEKKPELAGFIIALPVSTLLVLALTHFSVGESDPTKTVTLAKSIFVSIPLSLVFFAPFFFVEKLQLSFWTAYGAGVLLLALAYVAHRFILTVL